MNRREILKRAKQDPQFRRWAIRQINSIQKIASDWEDVAEIRPSQFCFHDIEVSRGDPGFVVEHFGASEFLFFEDPKVYLAFLQRCKQSIAKAEGELKVIMKGLPKAKR